ncbi:HVO_0234 family beta-propeller protein [Halobacterium yunchengense]|uniref:HVO_0234 family beta-propeller protein n=1 Tax=Halobacterium yunchengense TaxID=3108497 RepID=UPI003008DE53
MPTIREKRVYVDQSGTVAAYVAAALGVAVARVSDDKIGEFALAHRCTARDVAATALGVAAATAEDVLVEADGGDGDAFAATGFGPAVAVTGDGDGVLAAGEDGRLARYDGDDWTTVGALDDEVRALDGGLVAAADGVHRVTADGVEGVGLDDARDVAAGAVPLAATADGLFRLGAGWMRTLDGGFEVAAADPVTGDGGLERAHAATADALYEHDPAAAAGDGWAVRDLPVDGAVADVAYATDATVVLTADGALAADAGDGFRHRSLGLRDASALAVVAEGNA